MEVRLSAPHVRKPRMTSNVYLGGVATTLRLR
jgi:hypothetical protein